MTAPVEDFSQIRVLIVDDQAPVRDWVRRVLARRGITRIVEASNGHDAVVAVTKPGAEPDLILCDLRMPERDGIETIRAFAALELQSAIVIMSVEDDRLVEAAAMLAELQGLRLLGTVRKPISAEVLQSLLVRMRQSSRPEASAGVTVPDDDFQHAFARRELRLQYQPKVWMNTGRFAGAEALVRWKHPQLGLLQPSAFISKMEASDSYSVSLTEFAVRQSLAVAGRWGNAGRDLTVAINVAALALDHLDLPERIEACCREVDVPTDHVTLEFTETQVARDTIGTIDVATRLRLRGFLLSVDDFGTGQSGLAKLQKLPFTEIKIDRQFVHGSAQSATKRSVVEASIALARSLRMLSVAEGVEDRADWDLLGGLGCDIVQGFFIARPMSEPGLEAWLAEWAPAESSLFPMTPSTQEPS